MTTRLSSSSSQHQQQQNCPPLLRTFLALFVVSSLLGLVFLTEESDTLTRSFRIRLNDSNTRRNATPHSSSSASSSFFASYWNNPSRETRDDIDAPTDDLEYTFDDDDDYITASSTASGSTMKKEKEDAFSSSPLLVTTWADTDEGRGCQSLLPLPTLGNGIGTNTLNPSITWSLLRRRILNASYYPPLEHGKSEGFRKYVNTIFTFYTASRLRRSTSHPAPTNSIRRILELVDNYKRQMQQYKSHQQRLLQSSITSSSAADHNLTSISPPDPIRILVMGGSVTKGTNSLASSEVWLGRKPGTSEAFYAWPARLEHLLNEIFFSDDGDDDDGETLKGFSVNNYGMGATNSEVGAAMLEYQLVPGLDKDPPDIVIASYSTNDARDPDRNASFYVHLQNLVRAAHNTRPCDDDLPLVILADDMHGLLDEDPALEISGSLFKLASWYNILAVTFGNVARHASIASYVNLTFANPLLGNAYDNLHHGVGMHIGIAWTLLFNLMSAFQNTCADVVDVDSADGTNMTEDTIDSMKWSLVEPPTKFQGHISSMDVAAQEWKDRMSWNQQHCPMSYVEPDPYTTSVCTYAWTVNPVTLSEPIDIDNALRPVLVKVDGWRADYFNNGTVFRSPGFGTETPGSSFSLVVRNVTQETRYLTIFSMSSYGPGFANSVLRFKVRIDRGPEAVSNGSNSSKEDNASLLEASYDVKGSHDLRTSVFFPHKFRLPGLEGARKGDTIRLDAELVSGKAFKIQAVAFCRS